MRLELGPIFRELDPRHDMDGVVMKRHIHKNTLKDAWEAQYHNVVTIASRACKSFARGGLIGGLAGAFIGAATGTPVATLAYAGVLIGAGLDGGQFTLRVGAKYIRAQFAL